MQIFVIFQQALAAALEEERSKHEEKLKEAVEVGSDIVWCGPLEDVVQAERKAGNEALTKALEEERHQSEAANEELKV